MQIKFIKKGNLYSVSRFIYRFVIDKIIYDIFLYHYGKYKHQNKLSSCSRSQSHLYTSFYRSPEQLTALTGPILDHLQNSNLENKLSISIFAGSNGSEAYTISSWLLMNKPELNFIITCSDLHKKNIGKANSATYTQGEITQGQNIPDEFIDFTFDKVDDYYVVKNNIRKHVKFLQANILDANLSNKFDEYDIIFLQNVLFHLPCESAIQAFINVVSLMKSKSAIFIDGMELDMREELTLHHNLRPLEYKIGEIYSYSRKHIPRDWWNYYYGNEPYVFFNKWNSRRYCTIFLSPSD